MEITEVRATLYADVDGKWSYYLCARTSDGGGEQYHAMLLGETESAAHSEMMELISRQYAASARRYVTVHK